MTVGPKKSLCFVKKKKKRKFTRQQGNLAASSKPREKRFVTCSLGMQVILRLQNILMRDFGLT